MLEDVALERQFGKEAARFFHGVLEDHGVELYGGDELERFEGADGRVTKVVTKRRARAGLRLRRRGRRGDARRDARAARRGSSWARPAA